MADRRFRALANFDTILGDVVDWPLANDGVVTDRRVTAETSDDDAILLVVPDQIFCNRTLGTSIFGKINTVSVLIAIERVLADVMDLRTGDGYMTAVVDDAVVVCPKYLSGDGSGNAGAVIDADITSSRVD